MDVFEGVGGVEGVTQTRYFHLDHLGSIRVITGESGAAVERLAYDPSGKRPARSVSLNWSWLDRRRAVLKSGRANAAPCTKQASKLAGVSC